MSDRHLSRLPGLALATWALPCAVWAAGMGGVVPDGAQLDIDGPEDGVPAGVARLSGGGFVLGWTEGGGVLRAQRFDDARRPVGPSVQLACFEGETCQRGEVVGDFSGGFWGTWTEYDPWARAFLRRFSPEGVPVTSAIDLGLPGENMASAFAHLAPGADGGVLAVWAMAVWEPEGFPLKLELQARRFAADGTPLNATQGLNALPIPLVFDTDVAVSPSGGFVVVWSGFEELPGGGYTIPVRFRLLDREGKPIGPPGTANARDAMEYSFPKVAPLGRTGFLVLWTAEGPPSARYRIFDWRGEPLTKELSLEPLDGRVDWAEATDDGGAVALVHSFSGVLSAVVFDGNGPKEAGTVAAVEVFGSTCTGIRGGRFLVSWRMPVDGAYELTAQGFKLLDLFADGFESGDTSRWSSTTR
ncbi:MAG: hypothetical protein OEM05_19200 [Myxococcales bacterium]|nr:hypothetical protein [Myxococcales bacterium]MDH3422819.1 hypothetical protein [Gemmatimonadota bacterium]